MLDLRINIVYIFACLWFIFIYIIQICMKKVFCLVCALVVCVLFLSWVSRATTYTVNWNLTKFAVPLQWYEWNTIKWCDRCEPIKIDSSSTGCYNIMFWWVLYVECTKIFDDNWKLIEKKLSWSGKTNWLSVFVTNKDPDVKEWIELKITIDNDYEWKLSFPYIQKYENSEWKDISLSSKYIYDYSDELNRGYVKISSSDKWKINLSKFVKFVQTGSYRVYVEDKDWFSDYAQFYIWKIDDSVKISDSKKEIKDIEEEVYTSRSCKKYTIKYYEDIDAFSSPDLQKQEYFVSKDYFKRYVDSKNKSVEGCPTNEWWITSIYRDSSDSLVKYIAPNWKVYLLKWEKWNYSSKELDNELWALTTFTTIQQLKYYIRDRNFLSSMVY